MSPAVLSDYSDNNLAQKNKLIYRLLFEFWAQRELNIKSGTSRKLFLYNVQKQQKIYF